MLHSRRLASSAFAQEASAAAKVKVAMTAEDAWEKGMGGTGVQRALKGGGITLYDTALIEDDGPGFPPEMLERGIAAFGTTRKEKGGTGLGLFICKQIIQAHQGEISVKTAPGKGTTFLVELPANNRNVS